METACVGASVLPALSRAGRASFPKIRSRLLESPDITCQSAEILAEALIRASDEAFKQAKAEDVLHEQRLIDAGSSKNAFEVQTKHFVNNMFGTNLLLGPKPNTQGWDAKDNRPTKLALPLLLQAKNWSSKLGPADLLYAVNGSYLESGYKILLGEAYFMIVAREVTSTVLQSLDGMSSNIMVWLCDMEDKFSIYPYSKSAVQFTLKYARHGKALKVLHEVDHMEAERTHWNVRKRILSLEKDKETLEERLKAYNLLFEAQSDETTQPQPTSGGNAPEAFAEPVAKRAREASSSQNDVPEVPKAVVAEKKKGETNKTEKKKLGDRRIWHDRHLPMFIVAEYAGENSTSLKGQISIPIPKLSPTDNAKYHAVTPGRLTGLTGLEQWIEVESLHKQMKFVDRARKEEPFTSWYGQLCAEKLRDPVKSKEMLSDVTRYFIDQLRRSFVGSPEHAEWCTDHPGREFVSTVRFTYRNAAQ
jgi:hypothetical protein